MRKYILPVAANVSDADPAKFEDLMVQMGYHKTKPNLAGVVVVPR